MKAEIHPNYEPIKATCSCGNVIETSSTTCEDLHLDVCSACHPFYTGKQKILDSGGRIDRFRKRFGARGASVSNEKAAAAAKEDAAAGEEAAS